MKVTLPGLLPISILMFTAVVAAGLALDGPINLSVFQDWQALIGGGIAGLGILAASRNVTRQMRLTAQAREIDRLERELPGMRDARYFLSHVANLQQPGPTSLLDEFKDLGVTEAGSEIIKQVETALPNTHDTLRREVTRKCWNIMIYAQHTASKRDEARRMQERIDRQTKSGLQVLDDERTSLNEARNGMTSSKHKMDAAVAEFVDLFSKTKADVTVAESRLDRLRYELQLHVD